jgi:hypothetical protein
MYEAKVVNAVRLWLVQNGSLALLVRIQDGRKRLDFAQAFARIHPDQQGHRIEAMGVFRFVVGSPYADGLTLRLAPAAGGLVQLALQMSTTIDCRYDSNTGMATLVVLPERVGLMAITC